jgi:hypothetical protein
MGPLQRCHPDSAVIQKKYLPAVVGQGGEMFNQYWIFDFRSKHRLSPSEATAARFLPVTASGIGIPFRPASLPVRDDFRQRRYRRQIVFAVA